jgi:HAMP domain-containing protein
MSFRNRLQLLWAILLIAPTIAVALLLFGGHSSDSVDEARASQGLRTAFAVYGGLRAHARQALERVAEDPGLRDALERGPSIELERRAEELLARSPTLDGLAFYTPSGRRLVQAGARDAVASAAAAPTAETRGRLGVVTGSTTTAPELAERLKDATGLEAHVLRNDTTLAATIPGVERVPADTGEVEIAGESLRAAYDWIGEPAGPPVRLGVLSHDSAAGAGRSTLVLVVVALLAIMAVAAISVLLLLRHRLDELVDAARRLRRGDHHHLLPVTDDDRLDALAVELHTLSDELAEKVEQVEQWRGQLEDVTRRMADAFATGLDPYGAVDLAVRTAVEVGRAEAGRAVPVDPAKMSSTRVGDSHGAFGEVLTAAERRVFRAGPAASRELLDRIEGEPRIPAGPGSTATATVGELHAVAAPLRSRVSLDSASQYLGVVSIARREQDFSESERDLFAYLAAQAAVSIENSFIHERVRHQAVTDELTGLANARRFHEALAPRARAHPSLQWRGEPRHGRHRRLQADQRRVRPPAGRSRARGGGPDAARAVPRDRPRRPLRR